MNPVQRTQTETRLRTALIAPQPSARLRAAMAAGTTPDPAYVPVLIERSAVEPDFYVRDMLTWALTRHPVTVTVPRILDELRSPLPQARSQSLHTLSKIRDTTAWSALSPSLLHDPDDDVARSAWRAAVALVPAGAAPGLAAELATELGRRDRETQLSLSRALVALGDAVLPALGRAAAGVDPGVRAHAIATEHLLRNPGGDFADALSEATRAAIDRVAPMVEQPC